MVSLYSSPNNLNNPWYHVTQDSSFLTIFVEDNHGADNTIIQVNNPDCLRDIHSHDNPNNHMKDI